MKRSTLIGTAILALAVAGQAFAQQDIPTELSGEIDNYFIVPSSAESDGHLIVRVIPDDARDASENILIDLGPPKDIRQQDVRSGNRISASGYADKAAGFDVLVAEETTFGTKRSQERQAREQDVERSEPEDQPRGQRAQQRLTPQQAIQQHLQSQTSPADAEELRSAKKRQAQLQIEPEDWPIDEQQERSSQARPFDERQERQAREQDVERSEPEDQPRGQRAQEQPRNNQRIQQHFESQMSQRQKTLHQRQERPQDSPVDERQEQQAREQDVEVSEREDQPREQRMTAQQRIQRNIQSQMSLRDAEEPSRRAQESQQQQKAESQDWPTDERQEQQARTQEMERSEGEDRQRGQRAQEQPRNNQRIQQHFESQMSQRQKTLHQRQERPQDSPADERQKLMQKDPEFKKVARGDYERRDSRSEENDRQFAKAFSEFWGSGQSQDTRTIHGTVDSTKDISIRGADDDHRFVKVRSEQTEDTWIVDLGAIGKLKQIDLQAGDRVMIQGQPSRLDDRPVLRATQLAEVVPLNEDRQTRSAARGYESDEQRR